LESSIVSLVYIFLLIRYLSGQATVLLTTKMSVNVRTVGQGFNKC